MIHVESAIQDEPAVARGLSVNQKIDVCRGLFAILIVIAHGLDMSWAIFPSSRDALAWWIRDPLSYVVCAGTYWVIGFFVISGYCIQLSVSRLTRSETFPLFQYLIARLTRILPLYYLGLLVAMVVECVIAEDRPGYWPNGLNSSVLLAQLVLVQNLTQTFGCYAPSWSITNEMCYYVFYGFLVWSMTGRSVRSTTVGMLICLGIALPLDLMYMMMYRSPFIYGAGMLFGLGVFWLMGAMVAEHREVLRRSQIAIRGSRAWPFLLILGIGLWYSQRVNFQFVLLPLGLAFTLMLVRFVVSDSTTAGRKKEAARVGWVELLGMASYPTYLFHAPLMMLVGSAIMRWRITGDWRVSWLILVVVGLSSGVALAFLAERPLMRWRAEYLKRLQSDNGGRMATHVPVGMPGVSR